MKRLGILVWGLVLAGCPEEKPPLERPVADAGPGLVDAGFVDAGPPIPTELAFVIDFLGLDGGVSSVPSSAGSGEIDPAGSLSIQFSIPLKDYRVRMFDGAEQVLPSDEEARAENGGMSYRVVLAAPLKPGRSYSFNLDAELGHEITDLAGRGYREVRVGLRVRGKPEPEPKKKPGKKRRK